MASVDHRVSMDPQHRVDTVDVGDVHRQAGVQHRIVRQIGDDAPPQVANELGAGVLIVDADVDLRGR